MKPIAPAPPRVGSDAESLAHERFVESFIAQSARSQLSMILVSTLVAAVWWSAVRGALPVVWLVSVWVLSLWRHFRTASLVQGLAPDRSTRRIGVLLFVSGLLQTVPLLDFERLDDIGRGVVTLVIVTLATVSVVTTSGFRSVFMAFAATMLLPLAAAWMVYGAGVDHWELAGLGVLLLLLLFFLHQIGRHNSEMFMENCAWRFGEAARAAVLQQALAEADEAARAKTQFLAAASHDLRQPIHSTNVLVAALSLRPLDEGSREIVALLGSVNQVLSQQLDTLLDISKLDAGVVRVAAAPCRIDAVAQAHHATLLPVAQQRGIVLTLEAPQPVWAHTDASLLTRTLANLSDNALKYTPDGGHVRIVAGQRQGQALLSVIDDGIGIPPDEHQKVFREFYQLGNVERDRAKGLGLGLSIVQRLCRLLGAGIELDSAPGRGTRVTVSLPLCAPPPEPERPPSEHRQLAGARVLVVDDEAIVRRSMQMLLAQLGCEVMQAEGAAEAEALARAGPIDVLLSDLRLRGGESGLEAIAAVRAHQPTVTAVLITGDTAPERIREAEAAGLPVLFKPVRLEELMAVMPGRA